MRTIDELLEVIRTGDTAEKGEAIYELGMIHGEDANTAIPILIAMLGDEDWGELAETALQRIGESALAPSIEFFKTAQETGKVNAANVVVNLVFRANKLDPWDGAEVNIAAYLHQLGGLDEILAEEISRVTTYASYQ